MRKYKFEEEETVHPLNKTNFNDHVVTAMIQILPDSCLL